MDTGAQGAQELNSEWKTVGAFTFSTKPASKYYQNYEKRFILRRIAPFYTQPQLLRFQQLRTSKSRTHLSLRVIDWTFSNFLKVFFLSFRNKNLFVEYKSKTSIYKKPYFDPISRGTHVKFTIDGQTHTCSVGQLHFFKWLLENEFDTVILNKIEDIRTHMRDAIRKSRNKKHQKKQILTQKRKNIPVLMFHNTPTSEREDKKIKK